MSMRGMLYSAPLLNTTSPDFNRTITEVISTKPIALSLVDLPVMDETKHMLRSMANGKVMGIGCAVGGTASSWPFR